MNINTGTVLDIRVLPRQGQSGILSFKRTNRLIQYKQYQLPEQFLVFFSKKLRSVLLQILLYIQSCTKGTTVWYVVVYGFAYSKSKDQPGKVANLARGHLNRENEDFPVRVCA